MSIITKIWLCRKRIALAIIIFILGLLAIEGLFRVWLRITDTPYTGWRNEKEIRLIYQSMARKIYFTEDATSKPGDTIQKENNVVHPYFGFDAAMYVEQDATLTEYFRRDTAKDSFDILILGGSVAGMFSGVGTTEFTNRIVADKEFRSPKYNIISRGRGGFKQPQHLFALQYYLSIGWKPRIVIFLDGFNEVALAAANVDANVNPTYPSFAHWSPVAFELKIKAAAREVIDRVRVRNKSAQSVAETAINYSLSNSAILGKIALSRITRLSAENHTDTQTYFEMMKMQGHDAEQQGPRFKLSMEEAIDLSIKSWSECSKYAQAICNLQSITFIHVLQPTLHDEGAKQMSEEEIKNGAAPKSYLTGVKLGYPKLRAEGERLKAAGVRFVDASMIFKDSSEELYIDNCHLNPRGNKLLGAFIATQLLK
ncbi:MAG: hypothetical protein ACKVS6_04645 [Planctomycetota bacterium]